MKIAYFIPWLYNSGGMERVLSVKANYLAEKLGYEVWIVTSEQMGRPVYFPLSEKIKVVHYDFPLPENSGKFYSIFEYKIKYRENTKILKAKISDFLAENKIDICISTCEGREFSFLPQIKDGSAKIAEFHFTNFASQKNIHNSRNIFRKLYLKMMYATFIKTASRYQEFIVLTEEDSEEWGKHLNHVKSIYNPLTLRATEVSSLASFNVLSVGRLKHEKGFDLLINAWEIVNKSKPEWKLVICGDGPEKMALSKQIEQKHLQHAVEIIPPTKEIENVYLNSSLYVLSSRNEGLGLVLMEAMLFGLPSVAFNCKCGPRELVDDGSTGFLTENGNYLDLAEKIIKLLDDKDLRATFGRNARIKSQDYTLEKIMKQWDQLFLKLKLKI
jgi:glycosyltransferase involved in cell wall biosynthesis